MAVCDYLCLNIVNAMDKSKTDATDCLKIRRQPMQMMANGNGNVLFFHNR